VGTYSQRKQSRNQLAVHDRGCSHQTTAVISSKLWL